MNHDETIFEQALGIGSPQAREEFLRGACVGNQAMFERVQGLLRAHDRAGKFLEHERPAGEARVSSPAEPPERFGAAAAGDSRAPSEKPGDRIGRYKLLQKIGEGGCGVVYMAEQEEPARRRVALKIIKLGMDTRQVIARLEAERQALAIMDHPNIAKIHDAGITDDPLPASDHPSDESRSSGRESAHYSPEGSESRLTSAATVQGQDERSQPLVTRAKASREPKENRSACQ